MGMLKLQSVFPLLFSITTILALLNEFLSYSSYKQHAVSADGDTDKYLLYYTHSGFSNQLRGLQNAAYLALATNRTLVLPPVLPHTTAPSNHSFPAFQSRAAGSECKALDNYLLFTRLVHKDVKKAANTDISFPSFTALLDFNVLTNSTGLKVMDMSEFAKKPYNTGTRYYRWCGTRMSGDKMVNNCGEKASFSEMVSFFSKSCGMDQRIAVIGSGFTLPGVKSHDYFGKKIGGAIDKFFHQLPSSPKFKLLLREMYAQLPQGYMGLHIRFKDGLLIDDCDDVMVKQTYESIIHDLNSINGTSGSHILIGNGNKAALKCFEHHDLEGDFKAITVNKMINQDERLHEMFKDVRSEKSTIYLLMDQILLGVSDQVVFAHLGTNANTFQLQIEFVHSNRDIILKRLKE